MPYKTVDVEIDLEDFDDDELIDEIRYRGIDVCDDLCDHKDMYETYSLIREIYELSLANKDYTDKLRELVYNTIGRIM